MDRQESEKQVVNPRTGTCKVGCYTLHPVYLHLPEHQGEENFKQSNGARVWFRLSL